MTASVGAVAGAGDSSEAKPVKAALCEKLVRRLSAHRTAALQAEVARHSHIALVALVQHLARRVLSIGYKGSPVNIRSTSHVDGVVKYAADLAEALAAIGRLEVRGAWAERLPSESQAMFAELLAMPQSELLRPVTPMRATSIQRSRVISAFRPRAPMASLRAAAVLTVRRSGSAASSRTG